MSANVRTGIYRHHKGGLFQVLTAVALMDVQMYAAPANHIVPALDATTGSEGRRLLVVRFGDVWPVDAPGPVPVGTIVKTRASALYIGLTVDGASPGPRLRVRELNDFNAPVQWPDGEARPRFRRVAEDWSADL